MFQGSLVLEQKRPSERETVFKGHFSLQSECGDMSTFQRQACKPLRSGSRAGNVALNVSFATLQLYSVAFSPHEGEVAGLREIFNFCFS